MRTKKRLMSLFLSVVMILSMLPTAAFAAGLEASARFNTSLTTGTSGKVTMSVDFSGVDNLATGGIVFNWDSIADYVTKVTFDSASTHRDYIVEDDDWTVPADPGASLSITSHPENSVTITNTPIQSGPFFNGTYSLNKNEVDVHMVGAQGLSELSNFFSAKFDVASTIPAGRYNLTAKVYELKGAGDNASFYIDPARQATWKTVTATLIVKNADGTLPGEEKQPHDITVASVENGTIAADKTAAKEGETVTLTLTPDDNYAVASVVVKDGANQTVSCTSAGVAGDVATYTFTMPDSTVSVSGSFSQKSVGSYTLGYSVDTGANTGSVTLAQTGIPGTLVNFDVTPASGYQIKSVKAEKMPNGLDMTSSLTDTTVADTPMTEKHSYAFTMPDSNVMIRVEFEAVNPSAPSYTISVGSVEHGSIHTNNVVTAKAGDTVTLYVKPDSGYNISIVSVDANSAVTVRGGSTTSPDGYYLYEFTMPSDNVIAKATFTPVTPVNPDPDPGEGVQSGFIRVTGDVLTSHNRPLANAVVKLSYADGQSQSGVAAQTVTDADGKFTLDDVSTSFTYTLQASYDTGVKDGHEATPGFVVNSKSLNISASTNNTTGHGELVTRSLSITLYYDWNLDGNNTNGYRYNDRNELVLIGDGIERVYAGADDQFLTTDDFYNSMVGGRVVEVFADTTGKIQSTTAYYKWLVEKDSDVLAPVYVGDGFEAGTSNDYYLFDVDHDNGAHTADVMVFIGPDNIPATFDDYYHDIDVNGDNVNDTVSAGADGFIATEDDWYKVGETTVYAGADKIAGTTDDWYLEDTDHDGIQHDGSDEEQVFVGVNRLPHQAGNYYVEDVNGDEANEKIFAGSDKQFNTSDDYYDDTVGTVAVKVYPGATGDSNDHYEFGLRNDHYDWSINNVAISVRVGNDTQAGTSDDEFDWNIKDDGPSDAGVTVPVIVIVGANGVPGTDTNYYMFDADNDNVDEKVIVGEDGIAGTFDDYYDKNVNGVAGDERVYAGADNMFDTKDDHYFDTVDGKTVDVIAADDGHIGTEDDHYAWKIPNAATGDSVFVRVGEDTKAGTSDDEFDWTIKDDGADDNGTPFQVVVIAGPDGIAGTNDDYYMFDADNDNINEKVYVGEDGTPGTADDYYDKDVDGATGDERVYAGNDGIFDTSDDHYFDEVDGKTVDVIAGADGHIGTNDDYYDWHCSFDPDGVTRPVFVGDDEQAGTSDDYYLYDVNGDNVNEEIKAGENGIPGTPDDHYAFNADDDAALEDVFVGRDSKPGTNDDYYDEDVNGDSNDERVYAGPEDNGDGKFGTEDDFYYGIVKDPANPENTVVVPVFAGEDKHFSDPDADPASDDYYLYDVNGDGTDEKIFIDGDSFAGTDDDWYYKDVDGDGTPEKVFVGEDEIPMTEDDYYIKDVNGDGDTEQVFAGEDSEFGTKDDWYPEDIDGDGRDEKIEAGEDGKIGTGNDFYEFDVDKDGDNEKVFVGEDKDPGTSDDYYLSDPDRDGEDEKIFADGDGIPGTNDDYYYSDPDKDGTDDVIHVGPDAKPGTPDDWYEKDVDGDGDKEVIHVGPDGTPGTKDDYYEQDIDNDGEEEEIRSGEDAIIGTEDDEYDKDVDGDGDKETNYVGPDKKPGTADDWYYPIITFDAGYGTVNGGSKFSIISSDLTALPTASRGGYSFQGWTLANSSAILTLEQVLALKVDTTVYASFRSNHTGGGGGGGGGGVTTYTVTFDSNGGSSVKSQSVASGGKVTKPAAPTRDGYKFTGWYTDSACKNEYDFTTVVKKGFTLYAGWEKNNVSENVFGLLTSDHISYIVGFDDGMVHGEKNMTRAQAAMVFYRLLNDEARAKYQSSKNSFVDCPANAWYNAAVSTLTNAKVLAGYGNGKFGPNDPITRAQFATICARIGKLEATYAHSFSDVPTSYWAYEYITAAADQGWVCGFGNDKFGPDQYITRSQVVAILNRVLERDDVTSASFSKFMSDSDFVNWSDNMDSSAWDYLYLIEAGNGHDYTRDADGVEIWTALAD